MHSDSIDKHESPSDSDILQAISQGEAAAFEQLMRRFNRPMFRAARSILKNDADAEDVVQEAYVLAFQNIATFRGNSSLSTWLIKIVINEAVSKLRKAARRENILQFRHPADWEQLTEISVNAPSSLDLPERTLELAQMKRLIEKEIDALPQIFRSVFVLRALEDMSVEETATCLEIPEATVRSRYFRAKSLLREALAREIDGVMDDAFSFDGMRCDRIVSNVLTRLGKCPVKHTREK